MAKELFTVRPLMKPRTAVVTIAVNTRTFVRACCRRRQSRGQAWQRAGR